MRTLRFLPALFAMTLLMSACPDDDETVDADAAGTSTDSGTSTDTGASTDTGTTADSGPATDDTGEDDTATADADESDQSTEDMAAPGTGTISGRVLYNGEAITGTMTVALRLDATDGEVRFQESFETFTTPAQPFSFDQVVVGQIYYVYAIIDVDSSDPFAPDEGDPVGVTEGPVSISDAGNVQAGINVEVR